MIYTINQKTVDSLYVHVPFCARKCDYCAFYSEPPTRDEMDRYVRALIIELEMVASDMQPKTVFFGGGTPSILSFSQWTQILKAFERLNLLGAEEWTVECNPATVSEEKARLLADYGVNRISMGVQSLDESILAKWGRIHNRSMVFKSYDLLRRIGFSNINLDLMFAIPGQSLEQWNRSLDEILVLQPEHIACYELIYEEDTVIFEQLQQGVIEETDEDLAAIMYEDMIRKLDHSGYRQYEIANFAGVRRNQHQGIPEMACGHNINYWRGGSYYGVGPSASGNIGGVRTRNSANTERYCLSLEKGERPLEWTEELSLRARAGETAAFGLRMSVGWSLDLFYQLTGFRLETEWKTEVEELIGLGWAELEGGVFRLTMLGIRFADAAAERFIMLDAE
ncbi:MAG TPA: radical SAM family heme chaperone HemW [Verrucomicrobia bacterium]|nr:radical SAM family heme chaperone HemW [Verrucomicrobiota bacterium]